MSSTPNSKGIEKPLRKEPKGGWKESTYYVCNVAFSSHNVIHRAMFFTGFLNGKNGTPGGYNGFVCRAGYEDGAPKYTDAFYQLIAKNTVLQGGEDVKLSPFVN